MVCSTHIKIPCINFLSWSLYSYKECFCKENLDKIIISLFFFVLYFIIIDRPIFVFFTFLVIFNYVFLNFGFVPRLWWFVSKNFVVVAFVSYVSRFMTLMTNYNWEFHTPLLWLCTFVGSWVIVGSWTMKCWHDFVCNRC